MFRTIARRMARWRTIRRRSRIPALAKSTKGMLSNKMTTNVGQRTMSRTKRAWRNVSTLPIGLILVPTVQSVRNRSGFRSLLLNICNLSRNKPTVNGHGRRLLLEIAAHCKIRALLQINLHLMENRAGLQRTLAAPNQSESSRVLWKTWLTRP